MSVFQVNAPWRGKLVVAKLLRIIRRFIPSRSPRGPYISDHLARDIGLSASDVERLRFEYPSRKQIPHR